MASATPRLAQLFESLQNLQSVVHNIYYRMHDACYNIIDKKCVQYHIVMAIHFYRLVPHIPVWKLKIKYTINTVHYHCISGINVWVHVHNFRVIYQIK